MPDYTNMIMPGERPSMSDMLLPQDRQGLLRNMLLQGGLGLLLANNAPGGRQNPAPYIFGALQNAQAGQQNLFRNRLLMQQSQRDQELFDLRKRQFEATEQGRQRQLAAEESQREQVGDLLAPQYPGAPLAPALLGNKAGVSPQMADILRAQATTDPGTALGGLAEALAPQELTTSNTMLVPGPDGPVRVPIRSGMPQYERPKDYEDPQYQAWRERLATLGRPSTTVNVDQMPQPPQGWYYRRSAKGGTQLAPIPGGPAAREIEAGEKAETAQQEAVQRQGGIVLQDIDRALDMSGEMGTTGFLGALAQDLPGTSAHDLNNILGSIRANVGFDKLQQMRANSPTGGALGQVSENENRLLQSVLGSLEQSQSREQFQYNLKRLRNTYLDIVHGEGNGPERSRLGEAPTVESQTIPPEVQELWEFMTPEERALWQN